MHLFTLQILPELRQQQKGGECLAHLWKGTPCFIKTVSHSQKKQLLSLLTLARTRAKGFPEASLMLPPRNSKPCTGQMQTWISNKPGSQLKAVQLFQLLYGV